MAILIFDAAGSNVDGTDPGTALNIGPGSPYRLRAFSCPAAPQTVQYAGSVDTEGSSPVSRKNENRMINLTIMCDTLAALQTLQAKYGKIAREGGTLKWTLPNTAADTVIADLLAADTFDPQIDVNFQKNQGAYCEVQIALPTKPYGRGAEITLSDHVETTLPVVGFTETGIKGDMPGLVRLVVDNDAASATMRGLRWGLRSRYYSSASTAVLYREAESSSLFNAAATAGPAGASGAGSNTAKHTDIGTAFAASFGVGTAFATQTHIGGYRVFVRAQAPNTNTGTVSVRFSWTPAALGTVINNDQVDIVDDVGAPIEAEWCILDLGLVATRPATVGLQGWAGTVQAKASVATDDVFFDYLILVPTDIYGEADSPFNVTSSNSFAIHSSGAFVSSGSFWADAAYEGMYPLVPTAGAEARTVEFIAFLLNSVSGGGTGVYRSHAFDDLSARVFYTPRYLALPSP